MLFYLVKKDFLIVKKYVRLMFAVCILIPPFMLWRVPDFAGPLSFCLSVIFSIFMLFQYVSQKENQYPKASALLCASPYPRKLLVLSKYVFCLTIYMVCCAIFFLETLIFPQLGALPSWMPIVLFLAVSVFLGCYLPAQYKLGYEKTKFAFVVIIMASPFILPQLLKWNGSLHLSFLNMLSPAVLYCGTFLIGLLIFAVSAKISITFFNRTDLA